jgi:hypothetical protein
VPLYKNQLASAGHGNNRYLLRESWEKPVNRAHQLLKRVERTLTTVFHGLRAWWCYSRSVSLMLFVPQNQLFEAM